MHSIGDFTIYYDEIIEKHISFEGKAALPGKRDSNHIPTITNDGAVAGLSMYDVSVAAVIRGRFAMLKFDMSEADANPHQRC